MLWRKLKLDWRYAIGELIIVTAGVLIALGIQQWNDDRLVRVEEIDILDRVLLDLESDREALDFMMSLVVEKEKSLLRVQAVFAADLLPEDPERFIDDVIAGTYFGFNQMTPRANTFNEVVSSGKFGLIQESRLRRAIADYYGYFRAFERRADSRETEFVEISLRVIPRNYEIDTANNVVGFDQILSTDEMRALARNILESPIRIHTIAEINLARFIKRETAVIQTSRGELVEAIEEYRGDQH